MEPARSRCIRLAAVAISALGSKIGHHTRRVGLDLEAIAMVQPTTARAKAPGRKRKPRGNDDHHAENRPNHLRLFRKPYKTASAPSDKLLGKQ
jgi:hypothetical protein